MKVKQLLDLECSFFSNTFAKPGKTVKVRALFDGSLATEKTGKMKSKDLDKMLASHVKKHGKDEFYNKQKELQCAITPSGVFKERRTYEQLDEPNPLVVIDIDNITPDLAKYKKYPWVVAAGESVSRKGVWILVYIENVSMVKEHFLALRTNVFKEADDLKDITRLRYISYGKTWVRDESSTIKPYTDIIALPTEDIYETKQLAPTSKYDTEQEVGLIIQGTGSIDESGGFHPWTTRVASRCNKRGISLGFAVDTAWAAIEDLPIIKETERYTKDRFFKDFKSVYDVYKHEHHVQTKVRITKQQVYRFNKKIYEASPKVLQDLVGLVEQEEEKEVVYFTSLILLGILFPNRCFKYFNNHYYPNLYGYILGDAASFKGKAKVLREALRPYQQRIDDEYKEKNEHKQQAIAYNKSIAKTQEERKVIDKIPDLNLFFDGNTSSAAMLKALQDSPVLVMFETEGDTITKTWKTDWGNYSDILRKTFEHESLYSLKKDGQNDNLLRIRIDKPKLSVLVSSTENQMRKVLNSDETENGLMSRFMFYVVQNDKKWYNGFENNYTTDISKILTDRLPVNKWFVSLFKEDRLYVMSKEALQYHQEYFNHVNDNWPDELFDIIALVRRAGTTAIRLALLFEELTLLDTPKQDSGLKVRQHSVSGESMLLAIECMKVLMQHLFVAWQTTYASNDVKETNIQTSETRAAVGKILSSDPLKGYKAVASELGISRDLARHHVTEIRRKMDRSVFERNNPGEEYKEEKPTKRRPTRKKG